MKKILILLLIFFISVAQISCKQEYSEIELKRHFSKDQIRDLERLKNFFQNEVCSNIDSDFESCINSIDSDSLMAKGEGVWSYIDFEKQKKLYQEIAPTFKEIWNYCESTYYPKRIQAQNLCAKTHGLYVNYLRDLGKSNPRIAKYRDAILASGLFSAQYLPLKEILANNNKFDLSDPNIQLILAIHYLTVNDYVKRNAHLKEDAKETTF